MLQHFISSLYRQQHGATEQLAACLTEFVSTVLLAARVDYLSTIVSVLAFHAGFTLIVLAFFDKLFGYQTSRPLRPSRKSVASFIRNADDDYCRPHCGHVSQLVRGAVDRWHCAYVTCRAVRPCLLSTNQSAASQAPTASPAVQRYDSKDTRSQTARTCFFFTPTYDYRRIKQ